MVPYANTNIDSTVMYYEIGSDFIRIKFRNDEQVYIYTYQKAGLSHVEKMKDLAADGKGLGRYIRKYLKDFSEISP